MRIWLTETNSVALWWTWFFFFFQFSQACHTTLDHEMFKAENIFLKLSGTKLFVCFLVLFLIEGLHTVIKLRSDSILPQVCSKKKSMRHHRTCYQSEWRHRLVWGSFWMALHRLVTLVSVMDHYQWTFMRRGHQGKQDQKWGFGV